MEIGPNQTISYAAVVYTYKSNVGGEQLDTINRINIYGGLIPDDPAEFVADPAR